MQIGDFVIVLNKDAASGVSRPSLAKIMSVDEDNKKLLVKSAYQSYALKPMQWVTNSAFCIKVEPEFMNSVKNHETHYGDFSVSDLVMYVDKTHHSGDRVVEGVVVNVTPKTVEVMVNGTLKIQRKKKSLVMHVV